MQDHQFWLWLPFIVCLPVIVFFAGISVGRWLLSHPRLSRETPADKPPRSPRSHTRTEMSTADRLDQCIRRLSASIESYSSQLDQVTRPLEASVDAEDVTRSAAVLSSLASEFQDELKNTRHDLKGVVQDATLEFISREKPVKSSSQERRRYKRHPFPYAQQVAAYDGENSPSAKDFFEVECHDISTDGISFFTDRPVCHQDLVITLGRSPDVKYMTARVVHTTEVTPTRFLVGCRFTGRCNVSINSSAE